MIPNPNGPGVVAADGFLHYSVTHLPLENQWLFVSIDTPLQTALGCLIVLRMRANTIQGDEVKCTLTGEIILRFTDQGNTFNWQRSDNGFFTLAPSSIRADQAWHDIALSWEAAIQELAQKVNSVVEKPAEIPDTSESGIHPAIGLLSKMVIISFFIFAIQSPGSVKGQAHVSVASSDLSTHPFFVCVKQWMAE